METATIRTVVITIIILLILSVGTAAILFPKDDDDERHTCGLNLQGSIGVDEADEIVKVSIEVRGGVGFSWSDYDVYLEDVPIVYHPRNEDTGERDTKSNVGETAYWLAQYQDGMYEVGGTYNVKIVHLESGNIAWEKNITAKAVDI